ncbi:TauD/TfdA dioxygenase family protein [Roseococcus pinisoli]|uniref:TauD/TfdA family dioxygenase n=1 Tax=Roseococcus pinisoli TaxID=2835040 RepID=A0ABS5QA08_9PROT|nr:TauD/TfdA family dioxygenase [Roseococcus pinisoli]MBS7810317.1 TauD/TfdA family dioxygenase [Roseococcus pinisoli]
MFTYTPLTPVFGARVEGADLSRPLTPEQAREIEDAMDRYAVLVFPAQKIDDEQQAAFGENFGPIEGSRATVDVHKQRLANASINDISNLDEKGEILAADDRRRFFSLGNRLWHSDSSFKATPAKYSMLHARSIPPEGGETEFADMRAAWDELPEKIKAEIRNYVCDHSLLYSREQLGFDNYTGEERKNWAPVPQRLVRRHAGSGRISVFLSAHIGRIHGLPRPEALMMIRDLTEFATQPRFVYSHGWSVGDLVLWDNRCTMHRGRPYDDKTYKRDMRRVTLSDVAPTLQQAAA